MKDALFTLFKGFHQAREEMAQRILQSLEQLQPKTSSARDMEKVQDAIDKLKARREKLLDLKVSGILSNEDFAGMIRECGQQIEQQNELMKKLQAKQDQAIDIHKRLQTIQAAFATFDQLATPEDITPALVDAVISRIDVSTRDDAIHLDFQLADGTSLAQPLLQRPIHGAVRKTGLYAIVHGGQTEEKRVQQLHSSWDRMQCGRPYQ